MGARHSNGPPYRLMTFGPDYEREPAKEPLLDVVWATPGRPVRVMLAGDFSDALQVLLHFSRHDKRTVRCPGEMGICPFCTAEPPIGTCIKAYYPVVSLSGKRQILALGEKSWKGVIELVARGVELRGKMATATRVGGPTSLVRIALDDNAPPSIRHLAGIAHKVGPTIERLHP